MEKILKFKVLYFCILCFVCTYNVAFAQNIKPTPYQKKVLQITKKYVKILYGHNMSMTEGVFFEQLSKGEDSKEFLLYIGLVKYSLTHSTEQVKSIVNRIDKEFKLAESLKNETDFRLEREAKARAEQEAYEKSDMGRITKGIKTAFAEWNERGEFEKEDDYNYRLQNYSISVFDSICIDNITRIKNKLDCYNWKSTLLRYDINKEFFKVVFEINGLVGESGINIPFDKAKKFKESWNNLSFNIKKYNSYDWVVVDNKLFPTIVTLENYSYYYNFPISIQNIENITFAFNDLKILNPFLINYVFKLSEFKTKIQHLDSLHIAKCNQKLDFILKNYNQKLLSYSENKNKETINDVYKIKYYLGKSYNREDRLRIINNRFEKYKKEMSISFEKLNIKFTYPYLLDSIFNNYNNQLLKNPYNLEKETITITRFNDMMLNLKQCPTTDDILTRFTECKRELKDDFDDLTYKFDAKYKNKYSDDNYIFGYKEEEFKKFYIQGKKAYELEVEKRQILSYLSDNIFIAYKDVTELKQTVNEVKGKPYYNQVLEIIIKQNVELNREWEENGKYFENQSLFFNAYTSAKYKKILRINKKAKKK